MCFDSEEFGASVEDGVVLREAVEILVGRVRVGITDRCVRRRNEGGQVVVEGLRQVESLVCDGLEPDVAVVTSEYGA